MREKKEDFFDKVHIKTLVTYTEQTKLFVANSKNVQCTKKI